MFATDSVNEIVLNVFQCGFVEYMKKTLGLWKLRGITLKCILNSYYDNKLKINLKKRTENDYKKKSLWCRRLEIVFNYLKIFTFM